ncbi:MAG: hypothetical protein A2Y25_02665 [Candidatus Melainabacteria bacterium GWF2_37_15]|nr:MAG: hypothetical protein A2Y25_02665 [Candidatus Melainabacteria bacterium GWF2_37_15]
MIADDNLPNLVTGTDTDLRNKFCEYIKCIKTDQMINLFNSYYNWYENTGAGIDYTAQPAANFPAAQLNNGMVVLFDIDGSYNAHTYGYIYVDTTGKNKPNMFGKDYLLFWIIKQNNNYMLMPGGGDNDPWTCVAGSGNFNTSSGCTVYYMDGRELP